MIDFKQSYLTDIIKPLEEEVLRLRKLKEKKRFFWSEREEEDLERKEELLLQKYEKLGDMIE